MPAISLKVGYRPVRVGLCIPSGDAGAFAKAVEMASTLWGGRFCPIIPVGNNSQDRSLVASFRPDVLIKVVDNEEVDHFIASFGYLAPPSEAKDLLSDWGHGLVPNYVDISCSLETWKRDYQSPDGLKATFPTWEDDDPLNLVLMARYGKFPSGIVPGINSYREFVADFIRLPMTATRPLPSYTEGIQSALSISEFGISAPFQWPIGFQTSGIFVGNHQDHQDLVSFWNLLAAGYRAEFYCADLHERCHPAGSSLCIAVSELYEKAGLSTAKPLIWTRTIDHSFAIPDFGVPAAYQPLGGPSGDFAIPICRTLYSESTVVADMAGDGSRQVLCQLPPKPWSGSSLHHGQELVVTLSSAPLSNPNFILPPDIPTLNRTLSVQCVTQPFRLRTEPGQFGLLTKLWDDQLSFRAFNPDKLIYAIFDGCGISSRPSPAGRVVDQLIVQLGGLRRCAIFKFEGIRNLIHSYPPSKSFTFGQALQCFNAGRSKKNGQVAKVDPSIYIEALSGLLERNVFRAGLNLLCPHCQLDNWYSLDELASLINCRDCGMSFNPNPLLRDKNWHYKRTGLFGRNDHQEGGLPVSLTLLAIASCLRSSFSQVHGYQTGTNLEHVEIPNGACETDLIVLASEKSGRPAIAIGECKSQGSIDFDDANKLLKVAQLLSLLPIDVFIVLSKLSTFDNDELNLARELNQQLHHKIILLDAENLTTDEPYIAQLRAQNLPPKNSSLQDMATASQRIFLSN